MKKKNEKTILEYRKRQILAAHENKKMKMTKKTGEKQNEIKKVEKRRR